MGVNIDFTPGPVTVKYVGEMLKSTKYPIHSFSYKSSITKCTVHFTIVYIFEIIFTIKTSLTPLSETHSMTR